jgi:outer membrane protein assembly factor BamB
MIIMLVLTLSGWNPQGIREAIGLSVLSQTRAEDPVEAKWVYSFSTFTDSGSSPALGSDGRVYVTAGCLFALDPQGTLKWKTLPQATISGNECPQTEPVVDSRGIIYSFNRRPVVNSLLYAVNPAGVIDWTSNVLITTGIPNLWEKIAVGTDGTPYGYKTHITTAAVNPEDGSLKWEFDLLRTLRPDLPPPTQPGQFAFTGSTPPVIRPDGSIFIAGEYWQLDGDPWPVYLLFYTFDPNGNLRTLVRTKFPGFGTLHRFVSAVLTPERTVYLVSRDHPSQDAADQVTGFSLHAYRSDGELLWSVSWPGERVVTEPVLGPDGTIYISTILTPRASDPTWGAFYAISPQGEIKWTFRLPERHTLQGTPAVGADGIIYLPTERDGLVSNNPNPSGRLSALDPQGEVLWSFDTVGGIRSSPALAEDGTLYFVAVGPCSYNASGHVEQCEGRVYALQTSSLGLADSPWPMFRHDTQHSGRLSGR